MAWNWNTTESHNSIVLTTRPPSEVQFDFAEKYCKEKSNSKYHKFF